MDIVSSCCGAGVNTDQLMCHSCHDHCGCVCLNCDAEWWDTKQHDCQACAERDYERKEPVYKTKDWSEFWAECQKLKER